MDVVEASLADGLHALESGQISSVELTAVMLDRIARYDRQTIALNAVPVLNRDVFEEAAASDARRRAGQAGSHLEGIPYTAKDSYSVKGMSLACGSPAFVDLVASQDAFVIQEIRRAGGVLLGRTNMPPMAAGASSIIPHLRVSSNGRVCNVAFMGAPSLHTLPITSAAFGSGSSNGSGAATAASIGFFGLAEETVSSGRSPASNNGLVAYTPSRGLISIRGNAPLLPTCDVIVPHCRSVDDLLVLLEVICKEDTDVQGDFWREQTVVPLPKPQDVRPTSFASLANPKSLKGRRLAVPRMYLGLDPAQNIKVRPSILALWKQTVKGLEALGATVVESDFPVIAAYEAGSSKQDVAFAGLSTLWGAAETQALIGMGWHRFLELNSQPGLSRLKDADPDQIFPRPPGALPDRAGGTLYDYKAIFEVSDQGYNSIPSFESGLKRLEAFRKEQFEDWLDANGFDGCVFPANADVGRADMDVNPESAELGWANGVFYSNGNRAFRHLGIPSTNLSMGVMEDTKMPVNLTFLGKAYSDNQLLSWAWAFESVGKKRQPPTRTPTLPHRVWHDTVPTSDEEAEIDLQLDMIPQFQGYPLLSICFSCPSAKRFSVTCNGLPVEFKSEDGTWKAEAPTAMPEDAARRPGEIADPEWSPAMLITVVEHASGIKTGKMLHLSELFQ